MAILLSKGCLYLRFCKYPNIRYFAAPFSKEVKVYAEPEDKVTHTGQHWSKEDRRLVRFVYGPKEVNPSFAIDLINDIPPTPVKERVTSCDGGGGALGHPKVYINLDQPGPQSCGYCGLRFILESDHH